MIRMLIRILIAIVVLIAVVVVGVLAHGWMVANSRPHRPAPAFAAATDSASLARGEHLALSVCASCHTEHGSLPLSGGAENFFAIPGGPTFGVQYAPNLTPGGRLGVYSDAELARAIREGINHEGRGMLVMPSDQFHVLSDHDLAAIIGWLRSQPAVTREVPKRSLNPLGLAVLGLNQFPNSIQPAITSAVADVPADSTKEYGRYLTSTLGCRSCHGPDLRGGRKGQFPPMGPDLGALATMHPPETLERALTTGVGSAGQPLNPQMMPWKTFSHLDHVEIRAIYEYLKSLGS